MCVCMCVCVFAGLVGNLPWIAQTLLDEGFINAMFHTIAQILQGSLMFFAFRCDTHTHTHTRPQ